MLQNPPVTVPYGGGENAGVRLPAYSIETAKIAASDVPRIVFLIIKHYKNTNLKMF